MEDNMEMLVMNLIVDAGSCRSFSMEAIAHAKEGNFDKAEEALQQANEEMGRAHSSQTDLIQQEAKGKKTDINLFMVHAQDHIMTAMVMRDLANEIVQLYKKLQ